MPFGPPHRRFANDALRSATGGLWLALPTRYPPSQAPVRADTFAAHALTDVAQLHRVSR